MMLRRSGAWTSWTSTVAAAAVLTSSSLNSGSIMMVQGAMSYATCLSLLTNTKQDNKSSNTNNDSLSRNDFTQRIYTHALTDVLDDYAFSDTGQDGESSTSMYGGMYDSSALHGTVLKSNSKSNSNQLRSPQYLDYLPTWEDLPEVVRDKFTQEVCTYADAENSSDSVHVFCDSYFNSYNNDSDSVSSMDLPSQAKIPFGEIDMEDALVADELYYDDDDDQYNEYVVSRRIVIGQELCDILIDMAWYDMMHSMKTSLEEQGLLIPIVSDLTAAEEILEQDLTSNSDNNSDQDSNLVLVVEDVIVEEDIDTATVTTVTTTNSITPQVHSMSVMFDIRVDRSAGYSTEDLKTALKEQVMKRVNAALSASDNDNRLRNLHSSSLRQRILAAVLGTLENVEIGLNQESKLLYCDHVLSFRHAIIFHNIYSNIHYFVHS
jgi:hypothetical protein